MKENTKVTVSAVLGAIIAFIIMYVFNHSFVYGEAVRFITALFLYANITCLFFVVLGVSPRSR